MLVSNNSLALAHIQIRDPSTHKVSYGVICDITEFRVHVVKI